MKSASMILIGFLVASGITAVDAAASRKFLRSSAGSVDEESIARATLLADSPKVLGSHGQENVEESEALATEDLDKDAETINLGGLGEHDVESSDDEDDEDLQEHSYDNNGEYDFLQTSSLSDNEEITRATRLADSPKVLGRHGQENVEETEELATEDLDKDAENIHLGGLGEHDVESSDDEDDEDLQEHSYDNNGEYDFLQRSSQSDDEEITRATRLADSPKVLGRHGQENVEETEALATEDLDKDAENIHLGGLGEHDVESSDDEDDEDLQEHSYDNNGEYDFLQRASQSDEEEITRATRLADSPKVLGRHGQENAEATEELATEDLDKDAENIHLGGLGEHDIESSDDEDDEDLQEHSYDSNGEYDF